VKINKIQHERKSSQIYMIKYHDKVLTNRYDILRVRILLSFFDHAFNTRLYFFLSSIEFFVVTGRILRCIAKLFGAHCNQEFRFISAVKCKK